MAGPDDLGLDLAGADDLGLDLASSGGDAGISSPGPASIPSIEPGPSIKFNVDPSTRLFANIYFPENLKLKQEYLASRGYESIPNENGDDLLVSPAGSGQPFAPMEVDLGHALNPVGGDFHPLNALGELGLDTLEGADDVLKTLPVAGVKTLASIAGLGGLTNAVADPAFEAIGAKAAGLDYSAKDAEQSAIGGAVRGVTSAPIQRMLGAVFDYIPPVIRKADVFGRLNKLFGLNPAEVADSMAAGVKGELAQTAGGKAILPASNGSPATVLENPIEEVYRYAHDQMDLFKPLAGEARPLATMQKNLITLQQEAGAELNAIGTSKTPGLVDAIDSDPAGSVPFAEVQATFDAAKTAIKQQMGVASKDGSNTVASGNQIDAALDRQWQIFKSKFVKPLSKEEEQLLSQYETLQNGGRLGDEKLDPIPAVEAEIKRIEGMVNKKGKLSASNQNKLEALKSELNDRQNQISQIQADVLKIRANQADPVVNFRAINDFKRGLQTEGVKGYESGNVGPMTEAMADMGGALGDYVGQIADKTQFGPAFRDASKRYSVASDMLAIAKKAIGQEGMLGTQEGRNVAQRAASRGLGELPFVPSIRTYASKRGGLGASAGLKQQTSSMQKDFTDLVDLLPKSEAVNPGASQASSLRMLANTMAAKHSRMIVGAFASRKVGDYLSPRAANASMIDTVQKQMVASLLKDSGVVSDEQRQTGFDLDTIDPNMVGQAVEVAKRDSQTLQDALQFGSEEDVGAALSQVAKMYPDLFPAPKTGIVGEVELGGQVKLFDPMDRARYANEVQTSELPWDQKAEMISELNYTNTVINPGALR